MSDGRRLETARIAVAQGSDVALALFRAALALETKSNTTDWVTRADREAEAAVLDVIRDRHLGEVTVAEEADGPTAVPDSGPAWIVDPIDGTNNYVRGIRNWATSVAAVVDGEPVAAVNTCSTLGGTYVADEDGADQNGVELSARERDQPATFAVSPTIWWKPNRRDEYAKATRETVERFGGLARFRCVQLTLSLIESGTLDGAIMNVRTNPWDSVDRVHLVKSAGGRVTDLTGKPWRAARPESSRRRRDRVPRGSVPSSRRDRVRRPASLLQDRVSHGRLLRTVSNDHRRPRQS